MRRSTPPPLSRRSLLAQALSAGGAVALAGACASDLPNPEADVDALADREPMDMQALALVDVRLPGEDPDEQMSVTVQGRRIVDVATTPDPTVEVLDMDGGFVIPGFVDSHVHMQFSTPEAILAGGVTTVRDLGGNESAAQALRGTTPLKILIAGRILTPTGGYPTRSWGADGTGREVSGIDEAIAAVDEQVLAGAIVVKVAMEDGDGRPMFDVDTLTAIVERARGIGLRVTAHCSSAEALARCIEAGVRELCHLPLYDVGPADMVRAAEAAMVVVPTLGIRGQDPGAIDALTAFLEAGGDVLYGSDLGNGDTAPGIETTEIGMMLAAGMSPAEVLRSATLDPALYLGLDTGRIEAGKVADLVVVGGNPFADHMAYDDVRFVMAGGEVVHRA